VVGVEVAWYQSASDALLETAYTQTAAPRLHAGGLPYVVADDIGLTPAIDAAAT
jgi:hypothetical protein